MFLKEMSSAHHIYSININTVKYSYDLKYQFSILIHLKI